MTLNVNDSIPRLAKRMDLAFREIGLEFHKTRPTRLLLEKTGSDPGSVMTAGTTARLQRLFSLVNERFRKNAERAGKPFK